MAAAGTVVGVGTASPTLYYKAVKQVKNPDTGEVELRPLRGDPRFVYRVGHTYRVDDAVKPQLCVAGFHACKTPAAILANKFGYSSRDVLLEVDLGDPAGVVDDGTKFVSGTMTICRVVTWREALDATGASWTNLDGHVYLFEVDDMFERVQVHDAAGTSVFQRCLKDGRLHSVDGKPALVTRCGMQKWCLDGELHREDGPALVTPRCQEWWLHGQVHRVGGPAVVIRYFATDSVKCVGWWEHGQLHREGNLPALELRDPSGVVVLQEWRVRDKLHRDDGPAVANRFATEWWTHGERHRVGLLAVERADGRLEWWELGVLLRREQREPVPAVSGVSGV